MSFNWHWWVVVSVALSLVKTNDQKRRQQMEMTKFEEQVTEQTTDVVAQLQDLHELQLALVGGGIGSVVFG